MPANYVLLATQTVGNGGAASVTFANIPQSGYTDLKIVLSARSTANGGQNVNLTFNSTNTANSFGVGVIDIFDYQSTTKNKVIRTLNGVDNNGSGLNVLQSSAWFSTEAINSMTFRLLGGSNGSNYLANTQFALYGVK